MTKHYSTLNLFLRSSIFFIYSTFAIAFYSIIVVFAWVLPLTYRFALIRFFIRIYMYMLKIICHIDYDLQGLDHIPTQATIILSKHQSTWETFFLTMIFYNPAIILKRELLWIPFFGWGLAASKPIAINRNDKSSAMQQILQLGKKCLAQGRSILMFPEGTRVPAGQTGHYKLGGARLAVATETPIIPVAHNAGRYWPKRHFIKRPGTIKVVIGPPIDAKNKTPEVLLAEVKNWIESTVKLIDAQVKA